MSRTFHTTPAFPRSLRGPRGAQIVAPTPCAECVAFQTCRPGACTAPFGCDSWVDYDGRRVDVEADQARLLALADARAVGQPAMTEEDLAAVLGTLEDGPAVVLIPAEAADLIPEHASDGPDLGPLFVKERAPGYYGPHNKPKPCRECRSCANYGFGCSDPISEAELEEYRDTEAIGHNSRPDCWERD